MIVELFQSYDVSGDSPDMLDKNEFIEQQMKTFKDCEDNIEFLNTDITLMDQKIKEVRVKLGQIKERDSGQKIDGIAIMKGSTLTINIIDGEFDDQFFDPNNFEPMI